MRALYQQWSHRLSGRMRLLMLGAALSVFTATAIFTAPNTSAHPDPAECNASGLQQFPSIGPSGNVYDGTTLTYAVIYVNSDPDGAGPVAPCNVTGADATITRPDGSVINVLTNATLNVGSSISCPGGAGCAAGPYTYVVNHANENGGSSVQTMFDIDGVLHQDADEEVASDHDTLSKTVIHPSTLLTKEADDNVVAPGTEVTYTYTETNDGDVPLTSPSVVDNTCAPVMSVDVSPVDGHNDGDANTNGILDVDEVWTYTCTMVINEDTTNVATGRGLDPNNNNVTWCENPQIPPQATICDQDERASTSVRVVQPLQVEKTAVTSYDRKWNWTIDKSADQTNLLLAEGESFTVNYDVTVNATFQDQNAMVTGSITVTNPVGNATATITGITDVLSDDVGPVEVDCGDTVFPFELAGGANLVCTYAEGLDGTDNQTNTATVTTTGDVPGGQDDAAVTFGDPTNLIDECITVSDTNDTDGVLPDQICADEKLPHTYEYAVTFGPDGGQGVEVPVACGETNHPNTASFITVDDANDTGATGSDNWNVLVTVECLQGCTLTQGYWKTHSVAGPAPFDENWNNLGDVDGDGIMEHEQENFFLSGQTWIQVFRTAPKGNAYYNLAHQYMAAVLNSLNGADVPANVQTAIDNAETLFETYTPAQVAAMKGNNATRQQFITLAGTLGSYNEGIIGPGHCDEQNPT